MKIIRNASGKKVIKISRNEWQNIGKKAGWVQASNDCGGFKPPKGHLDTQLYPECQGTETDRDVVKKQEKKNKKKKTASNQKHFHNTCPQCGSVEQCRCPSFAHKDEIIEKTNDVCYYCNEKVDEMREAKGKKYKYNPWAICTESVGRDDKEKYERCVKKVKKQEKDSK